MSDYQPKTPPWTPQQGEAFAISQDCEVFFLAMEPRTGKTWVVINTAARLYLQGKIQGLLVIAWPNGVHRNWLSDEMPAHCPDNVPWRGFIWRANRWKTKLAKIAFTELLSFDGLRCLVINAESLRSLETRTAIGDFCKACPGGVLAAGDETLFMQTPSSDRAKVMLNIAKVPQVKYRRILDGTPISNMGPFGLYSQVAFLDKAILGHDTYTTFKAHYSEMELQGDQAFTQVREYLRTKIKENDPNIDPIRLEQLATAGAQRKGKSWIGPKRDDQGNISYRNLDELTERLKPYIYRCTFRECFKDVPPPDYQKFVYQLTPEQRRVYDELSEEYRSELKSGTVITADMVLTRYLRLQQIVSNFVPPKQILSPCDACDGPDLETTTPCHSCDGIGFTVIEHGMETIDAQNPRLEAVEEIIRAGDQWLVWSRFNQEVDDVVQLCRDLDIAVCQYDGRASYDEKVDARDGFQSGKYQVFVAKQTSAGRGIPLWRARGHVFCSNFFSLDARQQAEMRSEIAHRRIATECWDIIAQDTIDDNVILPSLRNNKSIADYVLGDSARAWI